MYSEKSLNKYDYFSDLLIDYKLTYILDSLTGVIKRQYMITFINKLVEKNIKFTMGILDLDNFRYINDKYGHQVGDKVLIDVSNHLAQALGEDGIVGRFGGDEFIFIYFKSNDYNDLHKIYKSLYDQYYVLRTNIVTGSCSPFVTGTIGSVSYPEDSTNVEGLFELAEKALYRGKVKGRNCFIIYVKEKHKDIVVKKEENEDIYETIKKVTRNFDINRDSIYTKIQNVFNYLVRVERISDIFYQIKNDDLIDASTSKKVGVVKNIENMLVDDIYSSNTILDIDNANSDLATIFRPLKLSSILVTRIEKEGITYGYIMYAEDRLNRIWQNDEKAVLIYLSRLIAEYLSKN